MSRHPFDDHGRPESHDHDRPAPVAGHSGRWSIVSWAQAGFLAALVGTLVVLTSKPTPWKEGLPAWAAPTGHPLWVTAVAFAPDDRRLATGGADGAVAVWVVGRGAERRRWPMCWCRCGRRPIRPAARRGRPGPGVSRAGVRDSVSEVDQHQCANWCQFTDGAQGGDSEPDDGPSFNRRLERWHHSINSRR
jgi:hypothetical protein